MGTEMEWPFLPCKPIYDILLRSHGHQGDGCEHLERCARCFGARRRDLWDPQGGVIPCSYAGALGSVEDVRLVIV